MRMVLAVVLLASILVAFLSRKVEVAPLDPISAELKKEIDYGRELIVHTARYLGPKGSVLPIMGTRMNCQNCHLDAGLKPFGISLVGIHGRYPEYRAREGKVLTLVDRINNCIERPMNGRKLDPESREMKALQAYFQYLSRGHSVGSRRHGERLNEVIRFPKRAADPEKGKLLYEGKCSQCHGQDGQGRLMADQIEYEIPPLWGLESFNEGSNMHRNIKFAAFIKANMPLGATAERPLLSDEESFDIAAFINQTDLHPRPSTKWNDYPDITQKPIDFPFGPYADSFSDDMHRHGPFLPIIESLRKEDKVAYY
jgi:thiosulfate dehydrogenase